MRKYRSRLIAAVAAVAAAGTIASGVMTATAASASPRAAASGTEHFQLMSTATTGNKSSIIGTGVFTAGGTATRTSNTTATVTFSDGTFVITHSKGTGTQSFNPKTCLLKINLKGTYTLGSGTGAYASLSGSGTYQLSVLGVGAKSGGTCSKTLPPLASQQIIKASGTVTL